MTYLLCISRMKIVFILIGILLVGIGSGVVYADLQKPKSMGLVLEETVIYPDGRTETKIYSVNLFHPLEIGGGEAGIIYKHEWSIAWTVNPPEWTPEVSLTISISAKIVNRDTGQTVWSTTNFDSIHVPEKITAVIASDKAQTYFLKVMWLMDELEDCFGNTDLLADGNYKFEYTVNVDYSTTDPYGDPHSGTLTGTYTKSFIVEGNIAYALQGSLTYTQSTQGPIAGLQTGYAIGIPKEMSTSMIIGIAIIILGVLFWIFSMTSSILLKICRVIV